MQAPEDLAVVQKESPFRSARHSNDSPGSVGQIWHAPWIQDDAFEISSRSHYRSMGVTCRLEVLTGVQSILIVQKKITQKNRKKIIQKNRKRIS